MSKSIEQIRDELLAGASGVAMGARRLVRCQAVLWWLSVGLAALLLLLLGDILLRREELGLRLLSLLAWVSAVSWGAVKLLLPAWQFAPTPQQIAQWLESEQPETRGQLLTAVELAQLSSSDDRYGSSAFRQQALQRWSDGYSAPDWRQHLQTNGLRRAGVVLLAISLVCAFLIVFWPLELRVALTRLALPWSSQAWPRRDQLQLIDPPDVVAAGSQWQLEVIDQRPPLPERVEIQVRQAVSQGAPALRTLEAIIVSDTAIANLPAIQTALEVRAVGGDDQRMPWHRIEVVQPPQLKEYQFAIDPPDYSGRTSSVVEGHRIRVLAGSKVKFEGVFDQPVTRVQLLPSPSKAPEARSIESESGVATDTGQPIGTEDNSTRPADDAWGAILEEDGLTVRLGANGMQPTGIQQSISWRLSVATPAGLEVELPERWAIDVSEDGPPQVDLQRAELPEIAVDGLLALRGNAVDDLQLTEVIARLEILGQDTQQPMQMDLWSADAKQLGSGRSMATVEANLGIDIVEQRRQYDVDTGWDLAVLHEIASGQRIAVWLEACDSAGQWSQSVRHEYQVRNSQDLMQSIQEQQSQLLTRMRDLVDTQRRNVQLFSQVWETVQQSQELKPEQIDLFRNAAQVQHALEEQLVGSAVSDSMLERVEQLNEMLRNNRLDNTELAQELSVLRDTLQAAGAGALHEATNATERTTQQVLATVENGGAVSAELQSAADASVVAQGAALQTLEGLMDRLAESESALQLQRELKQIIVQQTALRSDTDQLQIERMSNSNPTDGSALDARQSALSADQQGLARRLDDWLARNQQLPADQTREQQALNRVLQEVANDLIEQQATAQMRLATEEIRGGRLNHAAATQLQVSQLLEESFGKLGGGENSQLGNLQGRAEGLRQTSQELAQLANAQAALANQWSEDDAERQAAKINDQQRALEEQTSSKRRKAAELGDAALASDLESAADAQREASQAGEQGESQQAAQSANEAAKRLEQAAKRTAERAEAMEQQAAEQQLFQLAKAIEQVVVQQQPVTETFRELATARNQLGDGNQPSQEAVEEAEGDGVAERQSELREVAAMQEGVRQLLREVRTETTELPAFDWTLAQAEESMVRAAAAAQRYRVEPDAREAAESAYRFLQLAAEAMQESASEATDSESQADGDKQQSGNEQERRQERQRSLPFLPSLKLLRSLQQDVNQQTSDAEAVADQQRRSRLMTELARMQQSLGEQTEQLLREVVDGQQDGM